MSYSYEAMKKEFLFTDEGQRHFLEIRDKVDSLLRVAGAFRMEQAMVSGGTWESLSCFDRLQELNEIRLVYDGGGVTQHRVYVRGACR